MKEFRIKARDFYVKEQVIGYVFTLDQGEAITFSTLEQLYKYAKDEEIRYYDIEIKEVVTTYETMTQCDNCKEHHLTMNYCKADRESSPEKLCDKCYAKLTKHYGVIDLNENGEEIK